MRNESIRAFGMAVLGLAVFGLGVPGCPKPKPRLRPMPERLEDDPPPAAMAKAITPEKLAEVQDVFKNGRNNINDCFTAMVKRKKDLKLKGTIIVGVTIGMNESPDRVWIQKISRALRDAKFEECVKREMRKWEFPTWGGKTDMTSPRYLLEVF